MREEVKEYVKELFSSGELSILPSIDIKNTPGTNSYSVSISIQVMFGTEAIAENKEHDWLEINER